MLDRKSKIVLNHLIKHKLDKVIMFSVPVLVIYMGSRKLSADEIIESLTYLNLNGYIKLDKAHGYKDKFILREISYEARHYNEFQWLKFKSFMLKSFFVPIIVSVIVSAICYYLFSK